MSLYDGTPFLHNNKIITFWIFLIEFQRKNCKTLFTLHQPIIIFWYTEALVGWRVRLTLHHSSPPLHLIYFFRFSNIHQKISGGWREVKSGEEWVGTLHLPKPLCLSGFQAKRWRVKSKKEIRILYDASAKSLIRQFLQYKRTPHFLPRLGILLPCTRAI